jgi:protein TonB
MNFAQEKNSSSRATGFGIVVLIHVLIVWALASGLARKIVDAVKPPIETKVIEEVKKLPPPPDTPVPPPPNLKAPPPPFIPPPEVTVTAPPPPAANTISQTSSVAPPRTDIRPQAAPVATAPPAPVRGPGPVKAAMVCTKMGKPDVPGMNWSGEALFKVQATVKAGRVVSVEWTGMQMRGGNDRKAQRAMQQSIQATLTDTYECPGDHVFEQEFQFKIE